MEKILVLVLGIILGVALGLGINALIVLGLSWVFGFEFSWKLVVGFTLIMMILKSIFGN